VFLAFIRERHLAAVRRVCVCVCVVLVVCACGGVQIAGYQYGGASRPDPSGDLRQGQLAALALPNVSVATAIDTGDWVSVHPPDKQTPSHRLATAALDVAYGMHQYEAIHSAPLYAGQSLVGPQEDDPTTRVLVHLSRPATTKVIYRIMSHISLCHIYVTLYILHHMI